MNFRFIASNSIIPVVLISVGNVSHTEVTLLELLENFNEKNISRKSMAAKEYKQVTRSKN